MEKRVLGRGLDALISSKDSMDTGKKGEAEVKDSLLLRTAKGQFVTNIPVEKIKTNKYQPREEFSEEALKDLANSIKEKGVLQPIIVRSIGGEYELIAGERRLRAAKLLNLKEIPAIIRDVSDIDSLELSIIENIQREDLNPIDQAKAYKKLLDEFNMTQESISSAIGKDRATVANILRLLKLPQKIQEHVSRGTISMGHAKAILGLEKEEEQLRLCTKIIKNDLSVRDAERYAKTISSVIKKTPYHKDPDLLAIEDKLRELLGTKVRIVKAKKGGRIEIEFYSDEDLERVITILKSKG